MVFPIIRRAGGSQRIAWFAALLLTAAVLAGCDRRETLDDFSMHAVSAQQEIDGDRHLVRVLNFLDRLHQFDPSQVGTQIVYHLNRWSNTHAETPPWQLDPMLDQVDREFRQLPVLTSLGERRFASRDADYVREIYWMHSIANWVASRDNADLQAWLEQAHPDWSIAQRNKLAEAERLFDWTIRNIMLTEPFEDSRLAGEDVAGDSVHPARQGTPGPGYTFSPGRVLLHGRGDASQRARVFIYLTRQRGIETVMLAIDDDGQLKPWLPAVLIDDQLFLFDTELGLPIPAENQRGIATLRQLQQSPDLLEDLSLGEQYTYGVKPDDLDDVAAMIDAAPLSMSLRMAMLQRRLTGDHQMTLTVQPSQLAERLNEVEGVGQVTLWQVPIAAEVFGEALPRRLDQDLQLAASYFGEFGIFQSLNPLVQARLLYFAGRFDNVDEGQGAKAYYMECRLPDSTIRSLATNRQLQHEMGLLQGVTDAEQLQQRILNAQATYTQSKIHSTFWMGLVQYESGQLDSAANWFRRSSSATEPDGTWAGGADYNLARCLEEMDQWEDARRLYLQSESPQRHGNLLRARQIARHHL